MLIIHRPCSGVHGDFITTLRHFIVEVHEWTAFLFIGAMTIHMLLHFNYIKSNLIKYGILKDSKDK